MTHDIKRWMTLCEETSLLRRLLVVVHPGSACGSADFNLGKSVGQAARDYLASDIASWNGPILIIDGELSDELPNYPQLNTAINHALAYAKTNRMISTRIYGDDSASMHQAHAARQFIKQNLNPAEWHIELTGAWVDNKIGCVVDVRNVFHRLGFITNIRDSALDLP